MLEARIAALEGGTAALAVASGAAAIAYTIQALAQAGEHIVAQRTDVYKRQVLDCVHPQAFRISTYFMGYEERRAWKAGRADFTSVHLGQVDQWCRETFHPDLAFFDVSLPDEEGYMSFGASGCCMHPFIQEETDNIVLQINRFSPYVTGQRTKIHISQARHVVWADVEKETIPCLLYTSRCV